MANIHQDGNSIRNIQVVSSNRVHSTHLCEANKCWIFKPFFCLSDKGCLMLIIKRKLKKINLRVIYRLKLRNVNVCTRDETCARAFTTRAHARLRLMRAHLGTDFYDFFLVV